MDGDGGLRARSPKDFSRNFWPCADWLFPHARHRFVLKRQNLLPVQWPLVDVLQLLAVAGVALLSAWAINELILERSYLLLRTPDQVSERAIELVMPMALLLAGFVKSGHYSRRLPFWTETKVPDAGKVVARYLAESPGAAAARASDHKLRDVSRLTPLGRFLGKGQLGRAAQIVQRCRGPLTAPRLVSGQLIRKQVGRWNLQMTTKGGSQ